MNTVAGNRSSKWHKLLWIDSIAATVVGIATLLASAWLSNWYRLPHDLVLLTAVVNLAYGSYSFSLATRLKRPKALIVLLVVANLVWVVMCLRWAIVFRETASLWGLAHLVGEALFVASLALLEWRWRELLRISPKSLKQNPTVKPG